MKSVSKVLSFSLTASLVSASAYSNFAHADALNSDVSTATISSTGDAVSSTTDTLERKKPSASRKHEKKIFYLGVCAGQVLFKQGIDLSNLTSGSSREDLKLAIQSAIRTCKDQQKNSAPSTATTTSTDTSTDTSSATSTSTTVSP